MNDQRRQRNDGQQGGGREAGDQAPAAGVIVQQTFRRYSTSQLARSFGHHRELIDAFTLHDIAWARCVMGSHIHSAKQTLLGNTPHVQA
jgi:DNA-binding FadR family transcriptional regulator